MFKQPMSSQCYIVLTMKVLLTVNVILGIMELGLIVLVSIFFSGVFM